MARMMALCSLPRTNPGNRKEYKRVNGPFTLYMVAGGGNKRCFIRELLLTFSLSSTTCDSAWVSRGFSVIKHV